MRAWGEILIASMLMSCSLAQPATTEFSVRGSVSDTLTSLLTVLQAFKTRSQAASAANSCSSAALDSNYQLCQAEVDANPDVCGTNCQAAVQYVSTNCLSSLNDAIVNTDPQNCIFTYTQGNSQTSTTTSAASTASATAVTIVATAAAAAFMSF